MATYVNDLRLKEIATGDESGTWGTSTNTNLELIGEAFSFGTEAITTNADTHTTTIADGSTDPGRSLYLKYTGTLDSACTITIGPNTVSKLWFIENGTSGSQNIIISQGSGANVTIPAGHVKAVYSDGAGSGAAIVDAFTNLNLGGTTTVDDLTISDDLTVTDDATVGGTLGVTGIVTLTDDLIIGDGKTIGSASDVDAMTIASNGQVTFSQTLIGTALDISGDIDVDGTTNLDVVDIDGAVDMASTLQVDGSITSSDGMTITTADNSDTLTLVSTDADSAFGPNLNFYRNSSSPADDDLLAQIDFNGRNDNSQNVLYANIQTQIIDASDGTEDGRFQINTIVNGTDRNRILLTPSETVLNENSIDLDFRVESNGNASMLFVDGGNDRVGIGTNSPSADLHITNSSHTQLLLDSGTSSQGILLFGDADDSNVGSLTYDHSDNSMRFETSDSERMRINSSGRLLIGSTTEVATTGGTGAAQVLGTGNSDTIFTLGRFSNNTGAAAINFVKSRNGTIGSNTIVQDDDTLGSIVWGAADGSDFVSHAAKIDARVDGTPGANDTPGRLSFYTTADGSDSAVERMRIDSSGNVGIGTDSPSQLLNLKANTPFIQFIQDGSDSFAGINFGDADDANDGQILYDHDSRFMRFQVANNERLRIDSSGNVGIGTTSPSSPLHVVGTALLGANDFGAYDKDDANLLISNGDSMASILIHDGSGSYHSGLINYDTNVLSLGLNNSNSSNSILTTTALNITSTGVGIGTSSPTEKLTVAGAITTTGALSDDRTSTGAIDFSSGVTRLVSYGASGTGGTFSFRTASGGASSSERFAIDASGNITQTTGDYIYSGGGNFDIKHSTDDQNITFRTSTGGSTSEVMRLSSALHVLIGTTTNQGVGGISFQHGSAGVNIQQNMDGTSGGAELYAFRRNSTLIGSITQSSTNAVQYNTSSDARLKDVTGSSRGLDVINSLNPVSYNWKSDNHADEGLIAQEVEELVPNAVNKDEDGFYSMDYSKLVTHLVKGMQEQQEQIESLKSEIANLKEN
jgi:hypothetical protein